MSELYLSADEAAKHLGVDREQIYLWAYYKKINKRGKKRSYEYDVHSIKPDNQVVRTYTQVLDIHTCKYCSQQFKTHGIHIHQRLCRLNPDRVDPPRGMLGKKGANHYTKARRLGLPDPVVSDEIKAKIVQSRIANGNLYYGDEFRQKMSLIACQRLAKHSKYTKNVEYKPGIFLESTYEVRVAEILDKLNIRWSKEECRLGYIWDDNGKTRRYIPDFYLSDYKIFLDPKNDYLIKRDQKKIESACKLNNITVYVLSNSQITEEYIGNLINSISNNILLT